MVNILHLLIVPGADARSIFKSMADMRMGGLNPKVINDFLSVVEKLPPVENRLNFDFSVFDRFQLKDITEKDFETVLSKLKLAAESKNKHCWHHGAPVDCEKDSSGKVKITAAHSIQNNGAIKEICENGHVFTYDLVNPESGGKLAGKNLASIFWGFCNKHDSIFSPIETESYLGTAKQNFLFAYRAFVATAHKKEEAAQIIDTGEQWKDDLIRNKEIFDSAIKSEDFRSVETHVIELPGYFPVAASSSFYLDFDFKRNPIPHSDYRMEKIFVTLLPQLGKSYFLLSYFTIDKAIYGALANQIRNRKRVLLDISILLAAHVENIYFNPTYFKRNIDPLLGEIKTAMIEAQFDFRPILPDGSLAAMISLTPDFYLENPRGINFFK
jgi:hypothetical protein